MMDYNNYYSPQANHQPPQNQHHVSGISSGGSNPQMSQHQQQQQQMMHHPMPQQSARQTIPPGHPSHHQQQQQPQMQHPNYQQVHPPHGPPISHSNSPHMRQQSHQQQTQHQQHNHQNNVAQQAIGSQHVHSQSSHHGPMPPHSLNQMVRPQPGPAVINHHHAGLNQSMVHHQQNFFGGGSMSQTGLNYHSQNHPHQQQMNQSAHHHIHHQPPMMHHGPVPAMAGHFPHHLQQSIGGNTPHFLNVLQTEFRIIEFNRRLQCRPSRYPNNPLPSHLDEHSLWWDRFASDFFEDDATLTLRLVLEEKPVEYTIGRTLIPRFFRTYFDGGVTDLSIDLRNAKETYFHPHMITLDCDQAFMVTNNIFKLTGMPSNHGVVVHTEGHLIIDFVANNFDALSIKSWRFYTRRTLEYIDRAILTTLGLPNNYFAEPITKQGLTKSTISYLKMCMIMEPMQELMYQHKHTKMDPRSCLRKILFERYKFRSGDDNRAVTNKRRKRKPATTQSISGTATNKKSKAALTNPPGNNLGLNSNNINLLMSPTIMPPSFSLTAQDVMVVGEPSMMGGDFGDDNERMITRLENAQYDPTISQLDVNTSISTEMENGNLMGGSDQIDADQNHSLSPNRTISSSEASTGLVTNNSPLKPETIVSDPQFSLQSITRDLKQEQQEQPTIAEGQVPAPGGQGEETLDALHSDLQRASETQLSPKIDSDVRSNVLTDDESKSQSNTLFQQANDNHSSHMSGETNLQDPQPNTMETEHQQNHLLSQSDEVKQISPIEPIANPNKNHDIIEQMKIERSLDGNSSQEQEVDDSKIHLLPESANGDSTITCADSSEPSENHVNSIQTLNDESDSSSQLACSTADTTPAIEQHQPVDNGVA